MASRKISQLDDLPQIEDSAWVECVGRDEFGDPIDNYKITLGELVEYFYNVAVKKVPTFRNAGHTLTQEDRLYYQIFNRDDSEDSGDQILTLPSSPSSVYEMGRTFEIRKEGNGELSLSIGANVTVIPRKGGVNVAEVHDSFMLRVVSITGDDVVIHWIGGSKDIV